VSNRTLAGSERVRCRNVKCRTRLAVPTSNDHKAFCTPYCHTTFYKRKCLVCEKELPGAEALPSHSHTALALDDGSHRAAQTNRENPARLRASLRRG